MNTWHSKQGHGRPYVSSTLEPACNRQKIQCTVTLNPHYKTSELKLTLKESAVNKSVLQTADGKLLSLTIS